MSDDEKNYEECLEEVQTNKLELSNDQIEDIKINLNSFMSVSRMVKDDCV